MAKIKTKVVVLRQIWCWRKHPQVSQGRWRWIDLHSNSRAWLRHWMKNITEYGYLLSPTAITATSCSSFTARSRTVFHIVFRWARMSPNTSLISWSRSTYSRPLSCNSRRRRIDFCKLSSCVSGWFKCDPWAVKSLALLINILCVVGVRSGARSILLIWSFCSPASSSSSTFVIIWAQVSFWSGSSLMTCQSLPSACRSVASPSIRPFVACSSSLRSFDRNVNMTDLSSTKDE